MSAPEQLKLTDPREREAALKARIEDAVTSLAGQLTEGFTEQFREILQFYSRFWTYSVRNCLLIQLQCPQATRCAGAKVWERSGYHIKRGEKAIWIWAPITHKREDPETGERYTAISGFVPVPVFDFSQLVESAERPLLSLVPRLPDDMDTELSRCVKRIEAGGIEVRFAPLYGTTLGTSRPGRITVSSSLDSRNRLFVLLHELVHALYHQHELIPDPERSREQAEFEAESVAYVTAAVMGLEHPAARDYLLAWRATPELLHQSLIAIQMMVRRILVLLEIPFDVPNTPEALIA